MNFIETYYFDEVEIDLYAILTRTLLKIQFLIVSKNVYDIQQAKYQERLIITDGTLVSWEIGTIEYLCLWSYGLYV